MKFPFKILSTFLTLSLFGFEILSQTTETEKLGYGEWIMNIDGEEVLMHEFFKPNDIIFDVGGHYGEWSLYALKAEPTIQITAFEPVPFSYDICRANLSQYNNVEIFNIALSNKIGNSDFQYYYNADGLSGFYYREVLRGDHENPIVLSVAHETLENFCAAHEINHIDFMKIDTEGAEWEILNGAKSLIKNHQIRAIQFEYGGCYIDAKTTLEQTMRLLTESNYLIFRIIPTGLVHISRWEPQLENYDLCNYFAICKEDFPGYNLVYFPI